MSKTTYAIIGVVVIVAVVAVAVVFLVLPAMQPSIAQFELDTVDYGYDRPEFAPTLTVKAGQLVRVTLSNVGAETHEFMVVKNKDMSLNMMKGMMSEIDAMNISEEEKLEIYDARHHGMKDQMAAFGISQEVDPDEEAVLEFTIEEPGTYWYVCHNAGGTWPEIHQERGMVGKLIVEQP